MTAATTLPDVTVADASEENPWARAWRRLKRRPAPGIFDQLPGKIGEPPARQPGFPDQPQGSRERKALLGVILVIHKQRLLEHGLDQLLAAAGRPATVNLID